MHIAGPTRVSIIDADPDLARGLDPTRAQAAAQRLVAPVLHLRRGAWAPPADAAEAAGACGLLVLDGLIVREAWVGDHPCADLIGPGDLLRLDTGDEADELLPRTIEWTVLSPARVAVIGTALVAAAAPWPEVLCSLIDRGTRRADRLNVLQAITHLTRVDDRLHALLWYLAERWGKVCPEGVAVGLRLPHRTLAGMVGARRPSVTTALGQLMARGAVVRRADGAWVLRGGPPDRGLESTVATDGAAAAIHPLSA